MPASFYLCNFTKQETVGNHLPASKASEFLLNPGAGAVALWYLFRNRGDQIAFVSDWDIQESRTFFGHDAKVISSFTDKTDETIAHAIAAGILEDHGRLWTDDLAPDTVYVRDIRVNHRPGRTPPDNLH